VSDPKAPEDGELVGFSGDRREARRGGWKDPLPLRLTANVFHLVPCKPVSQSQCEKMKETDWAKHCKAASAANKTTVPFFFPVPDIWLKFFLQKPRYPVEAYHFFMKATKGWDKRGDAIKQARRLALDCNGHTKMSSSRTNFTTQQRFLRETVLSSRPHALLHARTLLAATHAGPTLTQVRPDRVPSFTAARSMGTPCLTVTVVPTAPARLGGVCKAQPYIRVTLGERNPETVVPLFTPNSLRSLVVPMSSSLVSLAMAALSPQCM
jgi:hypothetical protein